MKFEEYYFNELDQPEVHIGWNHPIFDSIRRVINEEEVFSKGSFQTEDGAIECIKCGGKKTYSYQKQVRSSDEGFTTFNFCFSCEKQWAEA